MHVGVAWNMYTYKVIVSLETTDEDEGGVSYILVHKESEKREPFQSRMSSQGTNVPSPGGHMAHHMTHIITW